MGMCRERAEKDAPKKQTIGDTMEERGKCLMIHLVRKTSQARATALLESGEDGTQRGTSCSWNDSERRVIDIPSVSCHTLFVKGRALPF